MKKRILSVVLALTMVIGSFNVVFAQSVEKTLIDADYAYAYAYAECNDYDGYASTSCYVTSDVILASAYVSAELYTGTSEMADSDSDSSGLQVSVQLSYYGKEAAKVKSYHEVVLDGVNIDTNITAYREN